MNSAPESTYGQRKDKQVPLGTSTEAWPPSLHVCTQSLGYQPCFSLPAPWGGAFWVSGSQFPTPWVLTSPISLPLMCCGALAGVSRDLGQGQSLGTGACHAWHGAWCPWTKELTL